VLTYYHFTLTDVGLNFDMDFHVWNYQAYWQNVAFIICLLKPILILGLLIIVNNINGFKDWAL
jgi:hypothetical protein